MSWISCRELMPQIYTRALVIVDSGYGPQVEIDFFGVENGKNWAHYRNEFVTHWMPLPDTPATIPPATPHEAGKEGSD